MAESTIDDASHHLASAAAAADMSPSGGTIRSVRDLAWLVRRLVRSSPRAAAGWIALSIGLGIEAPILLWATKGVADNLQIQMDGGDGSAMWWFAGAWIVVSLYNTVIEPFQQWCANTVRGRGGSAIVADTLLKATRIDLASYEYQRFYDRFARVLTDIESRATQILWLSVQCLWALPRFVTYLGVLLVFDWRLAALAVAAILPAIWGWYFSGQMYWDVWAEQTRDRRLAAYYADLLTNRRAAAEIRLFGLVPALIERWDNRYWQAARELRNRGLRTGVKQRGLSLVTMAISMFGFAWYVTTIDEVPSAGTVVIVIASYLELYSGVINLAQPIQGLGKNAGHASDLRTFLNLPEEGDGRSESMPDSTAASELIVEGVSYTYPGATEPTLVDISLRIVPGETVALVGENGAGKTTLVKLMLGLLQPDAGRVLLDGVDLAVADPDAVRRKLSGVFQHFTRYPLPARDNITLGEEHPDAAIARALDTVGLSNLPARLPAGLDTVLAPDLDGVDLSGGQWQRIAIARAGIRDASLVALDEPTASLDPLAEVAIFRRFADLAANRTTILVSHRLGMARLADRIVTLEHGRVVESGSHDDLLVRPGSEYARMWEAQAQWYR